MDPGPIAGQIILIIVLTIVNAFFAAAEMSMVALDKKKLEYEASEGDRRSARILEVLKEQSRFLSTIQVGITFAGFFNSASAATGISQLLGDKLAALNVPFARDIAFFGITLILIYTSLVFGELVPKRVALNNSIKFAKFSVGPISLVAKVLSPFVSLLSVSTNTVLRVLGIPLSGVEEKVTIEEIRSMVQVGQEQGVINPVEGEMIESVINFDDKTAEEIMTARPDVFMIDLEDDIDEYLDEMMTLKYSRIPVYEGEVDNILGILYLKDYMLESYRVGFRNVDIKGILRPAYFVPERKNINDLFNDLQSEHRHMALLIDEYGGFSGIVTMEDLIEEIVGDIDDEYDHDEPELRKIDESNFVAKGSLSIKEMNYRIGAEIDEDSEDYDTLGGLVIFLLGYIPGVDERPVIRFQNLELGVEKIEENRVSQVRIHVVERLEEYESRMKEENSKAEQDRG